MASNAKIGLLLGLVIIFLIMFVINGLSGFDNAKDNDDSPIVLDNPPGIKPNIMLEDFPPRPVPDRRTKETPSPEVKERPEGQPSRTTPPDETDNHTVPVKQTWPKVYIVCQGDNLADIAKKFYGPEEGNRRVNVQRIFQANNKSLESPDKIFPGQKLIIPSLRALVRDKNGIENIFPESMFEEVESIGRRQL
jgi:LysM repeat protein